MHFTDAQKTLNYPRKKDSKKLQNNTYLIKLDKKIAIRLYNTNVVILSPDYVELFTGGWHTSTTKNRLNTYSPINIYQQNHVWYVGNYGNNDPLFYEGIKVNYNGKVISKLRSDKTILAKNAKIQKKIKAFVKYAVNQVSQGIKLPSNGDCWFCVLQDTGTGKPLGEAISDHEHLLSHMREKYVVPTLVWNAVKEAGYQNPELIIGYSQTKTALNPKKTLSGDLMFSEGSIKVSLTKYLQKRLLIK